MVIRIYRRLRSRPIPPRALNTARLHTGRLGAYAFSPVSCADPEVGADRLGEVVELVRLGRGEQVADLPGGAAVRDTRNRKNGHLDHPTAEWMALVSSVRL